MPSSFTSVGYGLGSAACWGVGDFTGGMAAKRANVFAIVALAHCADFLVMVVVAWLLHSAIPTFPEIRWALFSGLANGLALAALYRLLSVGTMSIAAPLSAVLAAGLPVIYAAYAEGIPRPLQLAGFAVAALAIFLLASPHPEHGRPKGLGLAILSGVGFGLFFIALHKATPHSYFWPVAISRFGSMFVAVCMLFGTKSRPGFSARTAWLSLGSALFDLGGNLLFVVAAHTARIDIASVVASLYPAATVLLARMILKERVTRLQEMGIFAALAAVAMIAS